jgi:hypothetical protein
MLAPTLPPIASAAAEGDGATTMVFIIGQSTYTVNGAVTQMDVSPTVIEARTMLPIRFVAEPLGAAVAWDGDAQKVTIRLDTTKLELWIGQSNAVVNGVTKPIDPENPNVKPLLLNDRTMLPIRFVTESLGCEVGWEEAAQRVTITKVAGGAPAPETNEASKGDENKDGPGGESEAPPSETEPPETNEASKGDENEGGPEGESEIPPSEPEPPEASAPKLRDFSALISADRLNVDLNRFIPIYDINEPAGPEPTPPPNAPKAPTNLAIVSNSSQQKPKLTWKDNATDETGYYIGRRQVTSVGMIGRKTFDLPKDSTSYIDTEAAAGATYTYTVYAVNGEVKSAGVSAGVKAYKAGEGNVTSDNETTNKGIAFLGRGYDTVNGAYALPVTDKGMKQPVLDWKKMVEFREIRKDPYVGEDIYSEVIEKSAYDYCKEVTNSVKVSGSYAGFSASVETNFGKTSKTSNNKYLATKTRVARLYEYTIASPFSFDWSAYLLPSAQRAINNTEPGQNITPAQVLDTYGTHVITSMHVGGRMDFNCSIESESTSSFSTFSASVKASYSCGIGGASGQYTNEQKEAINKFNSKAKINVIFYGGLGDMNVMTENEAINAQNNWRNSVTNNPTFVDFGGLQLKPIWELCSDQKRSNEIKAEFTKRANAVPGLFPEPRYITGIQFPTVNSYTGYESAGGIDINPKGNGTYLFYLYGENENMAYTDIFVKYYSHSPDIPAVVKNAIDPSSAWKTSNNSSTIADYWRRGGNLRAGAKKGEVLFFVTRDTSKKPIKRIEVMVDPKEPDWDKLAKDEPGWEYVMLQNEKMPAKKPFDFRKDLKGDYIYIRFMRE